MLFATLSFLYAFPSAIFKNAESSSWKGWSRNTAFILWDHLIFIKFYNLCHCICKKAYLCVAWNHNFIKIDSMFVWLTICHGKFIWKQLSWLSRKLLRERMRLTIYVKPKPQKFTYIIVIVLNDRFQLVLSKVQLAFSKVLDTWKN